jgi:hypothetical protein
MHTLDFVAQPLIPSLSFVVRASLVVPDLAPIKALKLRMSLATERCSERAPRAAASVAVAGEPSRATTAAARPQQEEAAAQALVPHDPNQGRVQTRSEGRSARGHETIEAPVGGDSAP